MEVIVVERFGRWKIGDIVEVKAGFARNYLLPKKWVLRATAGNKERFAQEKARLEEVNLQKKAEAEGVCQSLDGQSFIVLRQAGESGHLYGSVSPRDIAQLIEEAGFAIERRHVFLPAPIRAIGVYSVQVALHPEVVVTVRVNVARSQEEAQAQERGESFVGSAAEREEARQHAEALLAEIQENAQERWE